MTTDFGLRLYFKQIENGKNVLLGTDIRAKSESFVFVYWLPSDLLSNSTDLILLLELFIFRFGIKIKVNNVENYIIKNQRKIIYGELENFEKQIIDHKLKGGIHINYCHIYSSRVIGSLNYIFIDFLFAINIYKYQFWLFQLEIEILRVRRGWYDWVENLKHLIRPDGQTKIEISKPEKVIKDEVPESDLKDITIR